MEAIYQYAWKHRLWGGPQATLCDGRKVRIVSPGLLNIDAGPDFSNACVECDGTRWHGNVEIHTRASDWMRHAHDRNPDYDNVILHVVAHDDMRFNRRCDGAPMPQLVISLPPETEAAIHELVEGKPPSQCHLHIKRLSPLDISSWLETLAVERLQEKAAKVAAIHEWCGRDWQQTLFVMLARAFGFGLNAEPMEMTARSIPLNYLRRHADNVVQLEAMLFGQAGMLNPDLHVHDHYYQYLCREYNFLSRKYSLRPISGDLWKMARTRPQNFPHRRIALLAATVAGGFTLHSRILSDPEQLPVLPEWHASQYWLSHYHFATPSGSTSQGTLPSRSADLILINAVAPYIYAYGAIQGEPLQMRRATDLLLSIPPEDNALVRSWRDAELVPDTAFRSQALIHLRKQYCDRERCRDCRFAHRMMQVLAIYEREGKL